MVTANNNKAAVKHGLERAAFVQPSVHVRFVVTAPSDSDPPVWLWKHGQLLASIAQPRVGQSLDSQAKSSVASIRKRAIVCAQRSV
jgi:hypothetical protein